MSQWLLLLAFMTMHLRMIRNGGPILPGEHGNVVHVAITQVAKDGYLGDMEEIVVVTADGAEKITDAPMRHW